MAEDAKQNGTDPIARTILHYRDQSIIAKRKRMDMNRQNFDCFHLNGNWDHKMKGQSREFLPKQQVAVEQITNFLAQGLVDIGTWFRITRDQGDESPVISQEAMQKLLSDQLNKNDFIDFMDDSLKSGLLGSLMIAKVGGRMANTYRYTAEESQTEDGMTKTELKRLSKGAWRLKLGLVRHENFHIDPTGDGLFLVEDIEMDL